LQSFQQRQREIAVQVPFMELIQHHRTNTLQGGIRKQTAGQDPFGDET
jgi:hypothetical protein